MQHTTIIEPIDPREGRRLLIKFLITCVILVIVIAAIFQLRRANETWADHWDITPAATIGSGDEPYYGVRSVSASDYATSHPELVDATGFVNGGLSIGPAITGQVWQGIDPTFSQQSIDERLPYFYWQVFQDSVFADDHGAYFTRYMLKSAHYGESLYPPEPIP